MEELGRIERAAKRLSGLGRPEVAVVLGSGLSGVFPLTRERALPFAAIPGFPTPTVPGHSGEVAVGEVGGREVLVQRGRIHLYEGHSLADVVLPVRAYARLGVRVLVLTNASGGIAHGLEAGDLVLLSDHINLLGDNPLRGPNLDPLGPRFPDMTEVYDRGLRRIAHQVAEELGLRLKEGVYLATLGPSYETPAEIRAFRALGADLVGMSTVPEAIAARHAGMRVLGISCVTNLAAGVSPAPLSHDEVIETSRRRAGDLGRLLSALVPRL
ncbi:MAG: purine-nucleoside phosphorylase [Candidatus Bipolaricaulota bacterium]|nr:purine-nucleoside phosphorylase [Candidatus Bipolaricaulota bacterium]